MVEVVTGFAPYVPITGGGESAAIGPPLALPPASAMTGYGNIGIRGQLGLPAASVSAQAGGIGLAYPLMAATVNAQAGPIWHGQKLLLTEMWSQTYLNGIATTVWSPGFNPWATFNGGTFRKILMWSHTSYGQAELVTVNGLVPQTLTSDLGPNASSPVPFTTRYTNLTEAVHYRAAVEASAPTIRMRTATHGLMEEIAFPAINNAILAGSTVTLSGAHFDKVRTDWNGNFRWQAVAGSGSTSITVNSLVINSPTQATMTLASVPPGSAVSYMARLYPDPTAYAEYVDVSDPEMYLESVVYWR